MSSTLDAQPEDYPEFSARQPIETQLDGEDFDSSNVHSLLYDFGEQELVARFYRDGADALYEYPNFPASEWQGLAEASSKGRYINLNVRDQYAFNRLRISRWPDSARSIEHPRARLFVMRGISERPGATHPHI